MSRLHSIVPILLIIAVAVTPIPLAANRDWAWGPLAILVGVALVMQSAATALTNTGSSRLSPGLLVPGACFAFVLVWALIQILPLDVAPNPLFGYVAEALGTKAQSRIAIDGERALASMMRLISYAGIFYLAALVCREVRVARLISWSLVVSAVVVTLYGFVMQVDNKSCITFTVVKLPIGSSCSFSGTFRNSSNYATFAGMAALVCVADLQARLLRIDPVTTNFRQRLRERLSILSGKGGLIGGALIILTGGLLLSGSKAGVGAFLVACVGMVVLLNVALRRRSSTALLSIAIIGFFAIAMAIVSGDALAGRLLAFVAAGDPDRAALYHLSFEAIALHPWAGWGLGGFESVYLLLQPANLALHYDRAHDSFLETAVELGIPAACLLVLAIALPVARCVRGVFSRSRDAHYSAMAVGAAILVAFQSLFDFSIQIPAVAVAFSAILGAGWAQSRSRREP